MFQISNERNVTIMKNVYEEPKLDITKFNIEENIMFIDSTEETPAISENASGLDGLDELLY